MKFNNRLFFVNKETSYSHSQTFENVIYKPPMTKISIRYARKKVREREREREM